MHPLNGPRLKLRRAEQHLNTIKAIINSFITSNPYAFVVEANPQPPDYVIVARIKHMLPDDELGLIIGDFAHNARSALDLLVYQLSGLPLDDRKRFKLQFPIFDEPEAYESRVQRYLAMVSPEATAVIEGFQPYKRVDGLNDDALGILRTINDTDKHRIIHVVGTLATFRGLGFGSGVVGTNIIEGRGIAIMVGHNTSIDFGGFTYAGVGDGIITKDRTVVAKLTSDTPLQVNMHPQFQISVKFGIGNPRVNGRPIVDTLTFIYDRVKEVIGEFESSFLK